MRMVAFVRVTAMALLLASRTVWSSHPSESALDQYGAREDKPQPPQLLTEATDHPPEVHRLDLINGRKTVIPDLQVGCADGSISENPEESKKLRRRRSFYPWPSRTMEIQPAYQSITMWKAPSYQLNRPYFVPIYGVHGRIPIYFPPQPLYLNPGMPPNNSARKPFQGPTYIPPPTEKPNTEQTTMEIRNRFPDTFEDLPVWDVSGGGSSGQRPQTNNNNNNNDEIVPTRRPPGQTSTHPPVQRRNNTSSSSSSSANDSGVSGIDKTEYLPPQQQIPEPEKQTQNAPPGRPVGPSSCVWAIISCCSATGQISYECFEQRGCPGAFWDKSPCDSDFARAAIASALNYYEGK